MIGKPFTNFVVEEEKTSAYEAFLTVIRGKDIELFRMGVVKKDGSRAVVELKPVVIIEEGEVVGVQGVIRDVTTRLLADEALRESQERFRSVIETSPEAIALFDLDGLILIANREAARFAGYGTVEELLAKKTNAFNIVAEEDRPKAHHTIEKLLDVGILRDLELAMMSVDGVRRPTEVSLSLSRDPQGAPQAVVAIFKDISRRKQEEAELAHEAERIESLLTLNQMADRPTTETVEKAVEEAIRLTRSEIGYLAMLNDDETVMTMLYWSQSAHAMCAMKDKPLIYQIENCGLLGEAVRQRQPVITNDYAAPNPLKCGTPEGHVPIVRHMNIPIFDGERIVAVAGVGNKAADYDDRDLRQIQLLMDGWWRIRSRQRAEESLHESQERIRTVIETSPDAIELFDLNGHILIANREAAHFAGYNTVEEFLSSKMTAFDVVAEEDRPRARQNVAQLVNVDVLRDVELTAVSRDGIRRPIEVSGSLYRDPQGVPQAVVVVYKDISRRKQEEAERAYEAERIESLLSLNQMVDRPMIETVEKAVEEAIRLTHSEIGYLAILNDDETVLTMLYWSKSAHQMCQTKDKPLVYPLETCGLWGEAIRQRQPVITNDYAAPNPLKRGTPEGHIPIVRHVNIPVFDGERIVAVAGVGNKTADYDDRDVRQLQGLMDGWVAYFQPTAGGGILAEKRDQVPHHRRAKSRHNFHHGSGGGGHLSVACRGKR